jgi:hypothetical protein
VDSEIKCTGKQSDFNCCVIILRNVTINLVLFLAVFYLDTRVYIIIIYTSCASGNCQYNFFYLHYYALR